MSIKTYSTLVDMDTLPIIQDPFWEVILDCKDHTNLYKKKLKEWDRSDTCQTATYNRASLVGLSKSKSVQSVNLTETYYFSETGFYRFEIRMRKHPNDNGSVTLYLDNIQIDDKIEVYHQWDHIERVRYPVRWIKKGNHDLKINLTKQAYVESIKIEKINRYTDNSDGEIQPGTNEIDVNYFDFTQNSVNQINTGKIKMAMQNDFWNTDEEALKYLPMKMGFTDSITIMLGPNRQEVIPMFGGYLLVPTPPTGQTPDFQVDFIDRLMDLQRNKVYHNFSIGTVSASNNLQKINYIKMGSVYELIRRLAETQEYPLNTYGIPKETGFYLNFAGESDFSSIPCSGWVLNRDPNHGQSPPCMKLTLPHTIPGGLSSIPAECVLFDDINTPWDASVYNMFFMHYYASGMGSRYPIEFNLKFTMYKSGQNFTDAQDYIVHVTGQDDLSNEIGDFNLIRDGTWRELTFDLDKLFDSKSASANYHIIKVSLVGTITQAILDNKKCSAIWLDNVMSYKKLQQAPQYQGQNNVKDGLAEINDVCTKTNHVAYTRPQEERCDDILVVLPEEEELLAIAIDETSNLISIDSWKNDPHGNNFINQSKISFSFANNKAGSAYYEEEKSIDHFGPFEGYDSASDINNQTDANNLVKSNVLANKDANKIGFGVTITGTTLLEIAQLMAVNVPSYQIYGSHKAASITQTMDKSKSPIFLSKIDMNFPSKSFLRKIQLLNNHKELKNLGLTTSNQIYRAYSTENLGNASPGTFS